MKKRLLFINGHMNAGGTEKSLLDILRNLDYERYTADLLLTEQLGIYADQLPPQVKVMLRSIEDTYGPVPKVLLRSVARRDWFTFGMRIIFLLMKLFGQKQICHAKKLLTGGARYDCVVGFRPGLCSQIAAYAVNAEHRVTWWHHGDIYVEKNSYLECSSGFDCLVTVSEPCREMMNDAFPPLASKSVTISNMLDADSVRQKAEGFDPYPEKEMVHIVSVGRLSPEKHFEDAIFAAQQLKKRGFCFRWHLVGDGVLRDELYRTAEEAGVTDCFVFEGSQVNPYPYIKHADLFVHPSYVESFGIVVAEALALGVPCVVTRSMGPCQFIRDRENGVLAEQSADDLTNKTVEILTDRDLYDRIRAHAVCPEQFLPERVMVQVERILNGIR